MSYRINSSTLKNSLLRAVTSCVLIALFALSLSGCTNHPEHTGPDESKLSVEATSPVKPPMNDDLDEDDVEQGSDEDVHTELEEAGEEQDNPNNAAVPSSQDTQPQTGSETGASSAAASGSGDGGGSGNSNSSGSSGSSNTDSSSGGSGSSSGSGGSSGSSSGGSSSTAASGSSGGQSSSGGGGSAQSSGQGQSQSQSSSGSSSGGGGNTGSNNNGSSSSNNSNSTNNSGSGNNNSAQNTAPQTITVSIEICARLAHAADPAAVAGITSSGTILSRRNVTVPVDASVRQALDATGVRLNARGAYIAGIAGLSEGDLGSQSGWMFSVNGAFSSQSASAHRLNAGDVIAWRYTINGGADLGASW